MDNKGFGVVEIMAAMIFLVILTIALRDELAAFASFLITKII